MMSKPVIKIDVVSDVVCPWCYIGKRRLEKAVERLKNRYSFDIQYLPFELNPHVPAEGYNNKKYLSKKFGDYDRYLQITQHVTNIAAEEGLKFDFTKQQKAPNTRILHRLILVAKDEGKQPEVVEALFKAYFEDGVDLTSADNIYNLALKSGLKDENIKAFLASEQCLAEVVYKEQQNQELGITGVPFYIINNKYALSGAQPTEVFFEALTDIAAKTNIEGATCDVDDGSC